MTELSPEGRHLAREQALKWLYQWEVGGHTIDEVFESERQVEFRLPDPPRDELAELLVRGTAEQLDKIDPVISDASAHWRLERLAIIDRLILRLAVYELLFMPGTPHAVIINEALELARTFSTEDAVKFVNGVLDGIRKTVRE